MGCNAIEFVVEFEWEWEWEWELGGIWDKIGGELEYTTIGEGEEDVALGEEEGEGEVVGGCIVEGGRNVVVVVVVVVVVDCD